MPLAKIPKFYLYGDEADAEELDFLHAEPIHDRSHKNNWHIKAHSHPNHLQLLLLQAGGGSIRLEDETHSFSAPCLVLIPAGIVHQIDFLPTSNGFAITSSLGCLQIAASLDPRLTDIANRPAVYPIEQSLIDQNDIHSTFDSLLREYISGHHGRRAAIIAQFTRALLFCLRLSFERGKPSTFATDRDQQLLQRYRDLLKVHAKDERAIGFYAKALAVTPAKLNSICKSRANVTSSALFHDHILTEAKRYLAFTDNSVAHIGHMTGFDDPSYFNRFFTRHVGMSPGAWREKHESCRMMA